MELQYLVSFNAIILTFNQYLQVGPVLQQAAPRLYRQKERWNVIKKKKKSMLTASVHIYREFNSVLYRQASKQTDRVNFSSGVS